MKDVYSCSCASVGAVALFTESLFSNFEKRVKCGFRSTAQKSHHTRTLKSHAKLKLKYEYGAIKRTMHTAIGPVRKGGEVGNKHAVSEKGIGPTQMDIKLQQQS